MSKDFKTLLREIVFQRILLLVEERNVNMCLAIQQMREESEIKGAVETYKDLEVSLADTIKRIAEKFHLSESESSEAVKPYW